MKRLGDSGLDPRGVHTYLSTQGRTAAAARPADWKANYYLGLIYWGLRREQDAMKMFAACGDRPDYAPAYISRAFLEKRRPVFAGK